MDIKVTIVVPVYNGEQYIKKCMESILYQSYKNIELIIINDGSNDSTREIINKICDQRIRVFDIKHKGVSNARNIGIENSTGDYIMFVDADDSIDSMAIENLIYKSQESLADIIRFNGFIQNKNKKYNKIELPVKDGFMLESEKNKEEIVELINSPVSSIRCYSPLLFMRNKEIIKFDTELVYLEDKAFYLENLLNNKKTIFIDNCLYYYNYNQQSKTKNINNFLQNINDILISREKLSKIVKKHCPQKFYLVDDSIFSLIIYRINYAASITTYSEFVQIMQEMFNEKNIAEFLKKSFKSVKKMQRIQKSLLNNKMYFLYYYSCFLKKRLKKESD